MTKTTVRDLTTSHTIVSFNGVVRREVVSIHRQRYGVVLTTDDYRDGEYRGRFISAPRYTDTYWTVEGAR